jgi:hypothetical protein
MYCIAQIVSDKLNKSGITTWMDTTAIAAGANIFNKIGEAVVDCKVRTS